MSTEADTGPKKGDLHDIDIQMEAAPGSIHRFLVSKGTPYQIRTGKVSGWEELEELEERNG